jgi:ribonucleoside-diphosphate reductase alpha chain
MIKHLGVKIDLNRDENLSEQSWKLLTDYYLEDGEHSPQQSFARASVCFSAGDLELAQRIYNYVSKGWFMFSSPILSNAVKEGDKIKGLPISCFLSYVPDTVEGLIGHQAELAWLSIKGGGVGGHWSHVRAVSEKSPGPIPFMKVVDAEMTAYKQGKTRKGSYAAYLDVSHPDIIEFLNVRVPTGGDSNRKCFNINNAVNVPDAFMNKLDKDEDWELTCPSSGKVTETIKARALWERILETRFRTGEPYINFIDKANDKLPKALKEKGLKIHGSNLCNEIHLPTSEDRTAVCCLSSLNLEYFEEWKETNIVQDLITYLDNVLQFFIDNAPDDISRARYSAERERSLGLGAMGFHSYLQSKSIPFESALASGSNRKIFSFIKEKAVEQTKILGSLRGEYLDGEGTGVRNSHLLAIAPNANSSIICGTSPSIEPWKSNAFAHRTRAGSHLVKNQSLEKLLEEKRLQMGKTKEWKIRQWDSVIQHEGSVQQLDYLSDWEKDVFKTAFEIDQHWIVEHGGVRQSYICQGQSLNLFFPSGTDKSYVNSVHIMAYNSGCKGLYYLRTNSSKTAEAVSQKVERVALKGHGDDDEGCMSCQG